jgi:Cu/Ag efflux protein CusF
MKKLILAAAASVAMLGAAYAATVDGVVQSVDPATRTVTLEDGKSFVAPESAALDQLTAGAKIKVTVDDTTGAVTQVDIAS